MSVFEFPQWTDRIRPWLGILAVGIPVYVTGLFLFGASPSTLNVGYAPEQPVPFSHALHAGELGMDCRYCHTTVESAAHAAVPPASVCMNCHERVQPESPKLLPVRESWATGEPVQWTRVHDLPDFVYFNHSAHVTSGVSCVDCHGRVDRMETVRQEQPLSMGWCLDCHRDPDPHIRPLDKVTDLDWAPDEGTRRDTGERLRQIHGIQPRTDCSTCHR
ncbi:MAG TPA: cytochrome C [Planctomycetes bacterium]|nr:cytochrome C [Planctomycetota bacterium]